MEPRRRQVTTHFIILTILSILVGVLLFSLIGLLITSEILGSDAKKAVETPELYLTDEKIAELEKKEQEDLKKAAEEAKRALAEKVASSTGIIYLTFDDGPGEHTAKLLDILEDRNVKVTFFITGRGDDEIIKREYDEGHAVGLHTWSHRYDQVYSSVEAYFADLNLIADRVKRITGEDTKLIRFPGGSSNTVSARYDQGIHIMSILTTEVINRGYQYFDWNISSGDADRASTADEVYTSVVTHLKPGPNVVLQHDIKDFSIDAVDRIIEFGLANNYLFLPLDMSSFAAHHSVKN